MNILRIGLLTLVLSSVWEIAVVFAQSEVPLYIKYRYEKLTGRKWYDATPERQKEFIDEIRQKREIEKQNRMLAEGQKVQQENQLAIKKAQKKLEKALREQKRQIAADEKKRKNAARKQEILLKKQAMEIKMNQMRSRQGSR